MMYTLDYQSNYDDLLKRRFDFVYFKRQVSMCKREKAFDEQCEHCEHIF
jgi:hypothetical protein